MSILNGRRKAESLIKLLMHLCIADFQWFAATNCETTSGANLVTDNRVFNGPLGRSLCLFARNAHSAQSLRHAHFARSLYSQARSLTLLTPSWNNKIHENVFML